MTLSIRSATPIIAVALAAISTCRSPALAAPQQLDCVLTDTEAHPGSENRPLVVIFDDAAKTLIAKEGDRIYSFSKVSISNISINGLDDSVSVGIDRSSFGIVWQQYGAGKVTTEYGHCRPAPAPK